MARALPRPLMPTCRVGQHLLDVITAGMYNDPLMVYREYAQNAVDALDVAYERRLLHPEEGRITIALSGRDRTITIEDNGAGVAGRLVENTLLSVGCSTKDGRALRGFRGIGRLGGLAYCSLLLFETRSRRDEPVTVVQWDGDALRGSERSDDLRLDEIVRAVVRVTTRPAVSGEPPHFFRVQMKGVRRFHIDALLCIQGVRDYLSQVAPVPYRAADFSHAEQLHQYFSRVPGYRCYAVYVNGDQVFRPYRDTITLSPGREQTINDVSLFDLRGTQGELLGLGWHATTDLLAAIPVGTCVRGIRVRQGNLQIGDEYLLAGAFPEQRLAMWHIGEVHLACGSVRPNARRDGFEHSPNHEQLLAQFAVLGRHLAGLCRRASAERSKNLRLQHLLARVENLERTAPFIDPVACKRALASVLTDIRRATPSHPAQVPALLQEAQVRLAHLCDSSPGAARRLDGRSLSRKNPRLLICEVCSAIISNYNKTSSALELVASICAPYLTRSERPSPPVALRRIR